jgi:uncharacterized repeat protein (TIGR01451 family)
MDGGDLVARLSLFARMSRRGVWFGLLVGLLALWLAQSAWADTGDVKIKPEKPLPTMNIVVNTDKTVTVTVIGGWSWPTHGKDCNTDRAGAGVAVAWFDPKDAGNALGASVTIKGETVPIAVGGVGNSLNAADNVVHPTENDTSTGAVADVASPKEYKNWRGGCGVFTEDNFFKNAEAAKKGELTKGKVAHGNFGKVAPGETDLEGNPFVNPTPPASTTLQGAQLKHTYASIEDLKRICAVMYDVHAGTNPSKNSGVGIPGKEEEIVAGGEKHNKDNGVQGNSGTPTGNACPEIELGHPLLKTEAGGPFTLDKTNGTTLKDVATLTGGKEPVTGTITFRLFEAGEIEGKKKGCVKELGSSEVPVNGTNKNYESGAATTGSFTVKSAGTYHWEAVYSGGGLNVGTEPVCEAANENPQVLGPHITVEKKPLWQSVVKGGTATFEITVTNDGEVDLENVKVTDLASPACEKVIGTLKVKEVVSYKCEEESVLAAFINVAEACGESEKVVVCDESEVPVGIEELTSEQDFKPADTATITVKAPAGATAKPLNGKVTFTLYKGSCEASHKIYEAKEVALNASGEANTESSKFLSELLKEAGLSTGTSGTYNWQISYGGDTNGNKEFTGKCGTEHFTVTNS